MEALLLESLMSTVFQIYRKSSGRSYAIPNLEIPPSSTHLHTVVKGTLNDKSMYHVKRLVFCNWVTAVISIMIMCSTTVTSNDHLKVLLDQIQDAMDSDRYIANG